MDYLCTNVRSILEKAALSIGFPKEIASYAIHVTYADAKTGALNAYRRMIKLPMVDHQSQTLMLRSCLEEKNPAQFLVSILIDVMADWLTEASLEEMPRTLLEESFQFSSRSGRRMDRDTAAQVLVAQVGQRLTRQMEELLGISISVIDSLSLKNYEGTPIRGDLVIVFDKDSPWFTDALLWRIDASPDSNFVSLDDEFLRHIVKLMSGCIPNAAVFHKAKVPVLIGCVDRRRVGEWEKAARDVVRFQIEGPMAWSFFFQGRYLFRRIYEGFRVDLRDVESELEREKLAAALQEKFHLDDAHIERITAAIHAIQYQSHGTSVLIMEKDGEVWNHIVDLAKHKKATRVQFTDLDREDGPENILASAARIDGAIVMDTEGIIGFIATIVDGSSCKEGDLSRGARFNSVDNFTEFWTRKGAPILSVVFSSDGGMDILPK